MKNVEAVARVVTVPRHDGFLLYGSKNVLTVHPDLSSTHRWLDGEVKENSVEKTRELFGLGHVYEFPEWFPPTPQRIAEQLQEVLDEVNDPIEDEGSGYAIFHQRIQELIQELRGGE